MGARVALALWFGWIAGPAVALAAQGQGAQGPFGELVTRLELHLPAGVEATGLAELIAVRPGQPLSRRAVRRSIERLMATERFADVIARAEPDQGGVAVSFDLAPRRLFAGVSARGNTLLTERELLHASRLERGEEFYPERLQSALRGVEEAYRRRGYNVRVEVELNDGPDGVGAVLLVTEGRPMRLRSISVAGSPGLPLARVTQALGLSVGDVLDRGVLETGVDRLKALYREQRFYRARVDDPLVEIGAEDATVSLPVRSGPRFHIAVEGNRTFPDAVLFDVLAYEGAEELDLGVQQRLARKLSVFYRYRGFHDARVRAREVVSEDGRRAVVTLEIEEGLALRVSSVQFEGNRELSSAALREILEERLRAPLEASRDRSRLADDPLDFEDSVSAARRPGGFEPEPLQVFSADLYRDAAEQMAGAYREAGFLSAAVALSYAGIDDASRTAEVRFEVFEGPKTLLSEVQVDGVPEGLTTPTLSALTTGQPLRRWAVESYREALGRELSRHGYLFAAIEADVQLSADAVRARVRYRVEPGEQVKVGEVIIQGLQRTDPRIVRQSLELSTGSVLDPEAIYQGQRQLALLGIFRHATVKLIAPEVVEPSKDVVVEVRERARLSGAVGGGYSLVDGPRVIGDAIYPNLFGQGINISARGKLNYIGASAQALSGLVDPGDLQGVDGLGGRGNVTLHQARLYSLLPAEVSAHLDLIGERVLRPSFRFARYAAVAGLDWTVFRWLTLSMQYEIEHDRVRAVQGITQLQPSLVRADEERLRFPVGRFSLHSVRPTVTLDFRDDPIHPRSGLFLSLQSELTRDLGAPPFPIYTLKLSGNLSLYAPLWARTVLALSLRAGRILPLDPLSKTIAPKRFYLGGATTMRGFREDGLIPQDRRDDLRREVDGCSALANRAGCTPAAQTLLGGREVPSEGGELFNLAKLELRLPAFGAFDTGLFFEAGNLWLSQTRYRPFDLRYIAGAGLRFNTPVGPFALDLGINLFPDRRINEPVANLHFSIGLF